MTAPNEQNDYKQNDWTEWLDQMTLNKMTRQNDFKQNSFR